MANVSIYLNFASETEEAFTFYKEVFKSEFQHGIMRFGDVPASPEMPATPDAVKNLVMHMQLPILNNFILMGSDSPAELGMTVNKGNNCSIMLQPDSREETRNIFAALSVDGVIHQELQEAFWGDFFGSLTDKFGIQWLFNCTSKD